MSARMPGRRPSGFTLVELAVALAVAALLTVFVARLLPLGTRMVDAERQLQELARAEQALLGYVRGHGRLPAADGDGDGRADGASDGLLPVVDLGLPRSMRIRYQAQPNLAAALPNDLFDPFLPVGGQTATNANGLDFCMRLLLNQRDRVAMAGLDMPLAYYLGHSGMAGHGRIDADAEWNPAGQRLPGASDAPRALAVVAAGAGELASRLACHDRLARTQGSAQAAYAAHSALDVTRFNFEFREFDILIAEIIRDQAKTGRDLAIYALAESITNQAIAITMMASGWPPDGATMTAGAKLLAKAVASIAEASKSLADAQEAYDEAVAGINDAQVRRDQVGEYRDRVQALYEDARDTTIALDHAGLDQ